MGDHTETVQVDYDPERITYSQLLDIFWKSHQPTDQSWSRQYKNAIFYHNELQRKLATDSKKKMEQQSGTTVKTEVLPLRSFTMAEDYHQKYVLKHHRLYSEILRVYSRHEDIVNSTAAARLNGYAGGYGSKDQLLREIDSLGVSADGKKVLSELVRR